ncbi:MAG: AmpG family muropeptide MFS transporter [Deltaproteobacteria bacterium]|nr:MAG: AmpG family muropeptide MFS transporter [Deltaproteobacteria bacterium]
MARNTAHTRPLWLVVCSPRMLVAFIMGFSCGLPLLLTLTVLQAWMREAGVDLSTIGLMALVGLPYTLKFLWAPMLDRFTLPFLGRRRGWLWVAQTSLAGSLILLGFMSPGACPACLAGAALLVTFFSASQDIVVDAYRREDLPDEELGLGASLYINGYRCGMLLASGGGLILADHLHFKWVYVIMAGCLIPGMLTTLFAPEPPVFSGTPKTVKDAVLAPLLEYFARPGALSILAFILLYKLGDSMASAMTTPFYLDMGFSKTEIGAIVKLCGFWAVLGGGTLGGILMVRLGIRRSLFFFGVLQAVSTAGFALLAVCGHNLTLLALVIGFENLTGGMGTAAYVAFMASITDKRFTATQYALLSSLMGVPRVLASAPTGYLADTVGWPAFFTGCTLIAIPGLMLIRRVCGRQ